MRYFFAIEPNAQTKLNLDHWRSQYLPAFDNPVPVGNFHITTAFLGQVEQDKLEVICEHIDKQHLPAPFSLTLDQQGYWSKPKVYWLGSQHVPEGLLDLVKLTEKAGKIAKINLPKRPYIAHLTLARKCAFEPASALLAPEFTTPITELGLYESISGKSGVKYLKRFSWTLPNRR